MGNVINKIQTFTVRKYARAPIGSEKWGCRTRLFETSRPQGEEFIVFRDFETKKTVGAPAPTAPTSLAPLCIQDDELKNFLFPAHNYAFLPPDHKTSFWFYSRMTVECTNLKSAQSAQLEQPAPKLELDLYIPQAS